MQKFTKKYRSQQKRKYRSVQLEILEERDPVCEGCGRTDGHIACAHAIPQRLRPDLICDKAGIFLLCEDCHDFQERGRYSELICGKMILRYICEKDDQYYQLKTLVKDDIRSNQQH